MLPHRARLRSFDYVGPYRYFLTCCTSERRRWFEASATVNETLLQIRQSSALFEVALIVWCFMPDHLHILTAGTSERSELRRFVKHFKQGAGFAFKQRTGKQLWQPSFHDRVLRDAEATEDVVRYILANPVRAGLVADPLRYPFSGSDTYRLQDLWRSS